MRQPLMRLSFLALLALTAATPMLLLHPSAAIADDDDDDDDGGHRWHGHRHGHWRGPPDYYYARPHRDRVVVYGDPDDDDGYYVERRRPRPVYVEPAPPVYVAPAPGITINIPLRFD
ncbi:MULTISPECIES: hypothetical protein [unclassified Inquilinus]|uniref:hypothetical protein n=1 Tax=unclassified Inquilinus TaxID=2645927 RepID=UPI003F8F6C70